MSEFSPGKTAELAWNIRKNSVRMTHLGNSSHIGSVLSCADILAVLYGAVLNVNPNDPDMSERDRFILSKGHAGAGVYSVLAETGFFPKSKLDTHYQNGSDLSGHVSHKGIPGVEFSTGSLGHGLSVGCGMALAAKLDHKDHRVVVLLSDGECDEGSNWEAFLFAPHHKLDNLTVVVDYNKLQSIHSTEETLGLEPFVDKFEAFGWCVREVDGHSHNELFEVLTQANEERPLAVIAHTTKGKGVSFMENSVLWHYRSAQGEEYEAAISELDKAQYE